jgi:hypothetical protein
MRERLTISAVLLAVTGPLFGSFALAQEEVPSPSLRAPSNTLELRIGTGYTQGFGLLASSQSIDAVAGPGIGINGAVDYRFDPRWSLGLQGEYQEFAPHTSTAAAASGAAGNVGFTYHASPFTRGDPFVRIGTGYRLLWDLDPPGGAPSAIVHGFVPATATVGYDFRSSPAFAIAPVVGADLDVWTWQEHNGTNVPLHPAQVGTYFFAGMQGRFDLGEMQTRHRTIANNK